MTDPVGFSPTPAPPGPDPRVLAAGRPEYAWAGGVATITLNHPQRLNAQLPETWEALQHIKSALPGATRVVLVRGAGSSFSAGLDVSVLAPRGGSLLAELAAAPTAVAADMIAHFQAGLSWLADPAFVSVAVVQGHAVGAGFQLALACDLIVAAADAQFAMAEVTRGLVPDLGGTGRLVQAVGARRALEMCVTGRRIDAQEAARIGLAATVVGLNELDAAVERMVAALTAADPETVRAVSRLIASAGRLSAEDQLAAERTEQIHRLRAQMLR